LNNLKLFLFILPISILFLIFTGRVSSHVQASGTVLPNTYLNQLLLSTVGINEQSTFPPRVVTIVTKDSSWKELVFSQTADEIVKELGIIVDLNDMVKPDDDQIVANNGIVQIVKVDIEMFTKTEDVAFSTKEVETETLTTGTVQVKQEGAEGVREKTIKIVHEDGKVVKSEIVVSSIVKEPIEQILLIGTKPVTIQDCAHWDTVINLLVPAADDPIKNNWMRYIMRAETWCDSGQNTNNKYLGLYQFLRSTYAGNGGVNIWDGTEQIRVVSKMYDICQQKQWSPHWKGNSRIMSFKDKFPSQYLEIEKSCGR
jgi:hypothetical protein